MTYHVRVSHTVGAMSNPTLDQYFQRQGSQQEVALALGVSKQTVNDWKRQGYVASRWAVAFERHTGIARTVACPQFDWGAESGELAEAKAA